MTSSIRTTLTGAALAAAITLGGFTSAHAQYIQPYNEPFSDDQPIVIATGEDEPLDGLTKGLWIYKDDKMSTGHEWVGLAGGKLTFNGLWENFWDIYHKDGQIYNNSQVKIDRFWATRSTLESSRSSHRGCSASIDTFILQVGERDVHGEIFGTKSAGTLFMEPGQNGGPPRIRDMNAFNDGFNAWGVDKNTKMKILNCAGGTISSVNMFTGTLENQAGGFIEWVSQMAGVGYNSGEVADYNLEGGTLDNANGYIGTLHWRGGTIKAQGNIGKIIDLRGAAAGMDGAEFDEGYVDEGFSDNAVMDDVDWQDAAPLGEEVMVW